MPGASQAPKELAPAWGSVEPKRCVLCKQIEPEIHWEDREELVEWFSGGGAESPRDDSYHVVLYRLKLLDQGYLFASVPQLAAVGQDW